VAEIDDFFAAIRQALDTVNMPSSWNDVPGIHMDRVKVEIQLDEKHYSLSADYGSTGVPFIIDEPPELRQRRIAIQDVLELVADYSAKRYRKTKAK
jgi:hypothetical protein